MENLQSIPVQNSLMWEQKWHMLYCWIHKVSTYINCISLLKNVLELSLYSCLKPITLFKLINENKDEGTFMGNYSYWPKITYLI